MRLRGRASRKIAAPGAEARAAGIGAAALPIAAYVSGEALPPLATAGLAALFTGMRHALRVTIL